MNDDPVYRKWRETSWRRPLTPSEQAELEAWLRSHPEAQADWEGEGALNAALERLPEVPVASNFTALVLQQVERGQRETRRRSHSWLVAWPWSWRWLPRAAVVVAVVGVGLVTLHHLRDSRQEKYQYARSAVAISQVESLPNPGVLENFDAIRVLDQTPGPDEELLKLLQ